MMDQVSYPVALCCIRTGSLLRSGRNTAQTQSASQLGSGWFWANEWFQKFFGGYCIQVGLQCVHIQTFLAQFEQHRDRQSDCLQRIFCDQLLSQSLSRDWVLFRQFKPPLNLVVLSLSPYRGKDSREIAVTRRTARVRFAGEII